MALGSFAHDEEDFSPEINTTPLVDVMLVLLIVFMVTIPVFSNQAPVDLPQATAAPLPEAPHIALSIAADGSLAWDGAPLPAEELRARLAAASQRQPAPELRLQADERAPYGHVARVLAAAQTEGLSRIAFITQPPR